MENQEKVIRTDVSQRAMTATLKDGQKIPVTAKVTETFYDSGRKDVKITVPRLS